MKIVDTLADSILRLFNPTIAHIKVAEPTGEVWWGIPRPVVEFVLAHPNSWEDHQQEVIHKVVVQAGIFNKEEALGRVYFVTEGEANFNYRVTNAKPGELLEVSSCLQINISRP